MPWDLGDQAQVTITVTDATGTLVDPAALAVVVTLPDDTTTSYSIGSGVTKTATGTYLLTHTTTLPGLHTWKSTATGGTLTGPQVTVDVIDVRPAATSAPPMVSLADAREHLRFSTTKSDTKLRNYVAAACRAVEGYAGRVWTKRTVTDTFTTALGCSQLRLTKWPVISVTTVTDNSQPATGWTITDTGILWRGLATDPDVQWAGPATVTYVAGQADGVIPPDIRQACLEMVRHLWETQGGGRSQNSQGDLDPNPDQTYALPWRVKGLIDNAGAR